MDANHYHCFSGLCCKVRQEQFFEDAKKAISSKEKVLQNTLSIEVNGQEVHIGMYAFAGEKFSDNPDEYPNLIGVVACVFSDDEFADIGHRGYILTLELKDMTWGEAMDYCKNYRWHGVRCGCGFLPKKEQWGRIFPNVLRINRALAKINATPLGFSYWSSSEYNKTHAWVVDVIGSDEDLFLKYYYCDVRCVVAF